MRRSASWRTERPQNRDRSSGTESVKSDTNYGGGKHCSDGVYSTSDKIEERESHRSASRRTERPQNRDRSSGTESVKSDTNYRGGKHRSDGVYPTSHEIEERKSRRLPSREIERPQNRDRSSGTESVKSDTNYGRGKHGIRPSSVKVFINKKFGSANDLKERCSRNSDQSDVKNAGKNTNKNSGKTRMAQKFPHAGAIISPPQNFPRAVIYPTQNFLRRIPPQYFPHGLIYPSQNFPRSGVTPPHQNFPRSGVIPQHQNFSRGGVTSPKRTDSIESTRSSPFCKKNIRPSVDKTLICEDSQPILPSVIPNVSSTTTSAGDRNTSYLNELKTKDTHSLAFEILKEGSLFSRIIHRKIDKDTLFLVMHIVGKVCQSELSQDETLMEELCQSQLPTAIRIYFQRTFGGKDRGPTSKVGKLFENLILFYSRVADMASSFDFAETFEELLKLTKNALHNMNGRYDWDKEKEIANEMQELMIFTRDRARETNRDTKNQGETYSRPFKDPPLPANFRTLSSSPAPFDIHRKELDSYIQQNQSVHGEVERYLQFHFRLVREDFIHPLRQGVQQFLNAKHQPRRPGKQKLKFGSVKFYENVRFEGLEIASNGNVGVILNFDTTEKMKNFKWEATKRLTYGSLLLFTRDNFQTFFCATVLARKTDRLKAGRILIRFTNRTPVNYFLFNGTHLMAETEAFYELYCESMDALKNLENNSFPLKEYVIDVRKKPDIPAYTQNSKLWDIFGFASEVPGIENWPIASELGLDPYQHAALKHVLTSKLSLIQGAPSTGKTFLTLKILQILLKNAELDPSSVRTPILVVAPTNYCIDRLLEGVLQFSHLPEVVRIAGPSHNELLNQFDLRGQLRLAAIRNDAKELFPGLVTSIQEVEDCRCRLEELINRKTAFQNPSGIVKYSILSHVMGFQEGSRIFSDDDDLIQWLVTGEDTPENETDDTRSLRSMETKSEENLPSVEDFSDADSNYIARERSVVNADSIFARASTTDPDSIYCCTIQNLEETYLQKTKDYSSMKKASSRTTVYEGHLRRQKHALEREVKSAMQKLHVIKSNLQNPKTDLTNSSQHKVFNKLPLKSRWSCYWNWIDMLKNSLNRDIAKLEGEYRSKLERYEEEKQKEDLHVLQNAALIGATTTGAIKFQKVLKELQPAIGK